MKGLSFYLLSFVATSLLRTAAGQSNDDNATTPVWALAQRLAGGESTICGKNFNDANATGIFYFNPNVLQGPQAGMQNTGRTQDSGLAVTVNVPPSIDNSSSNSTSSSYSLWYNTNGANYTGDFDLGYDVIFHSPRYHPIICTDIDTGLRPPGLLLQLQHPASRPIRRRDLLLRPRQQVHQRPIKRDRKICKLAHYARHRRRGLEPDKHKSTRSVQYPRS
jgi:hypothetical protein